ncbi:DUF7284 family protein [Halomicrococcus gelatinilyticus]|uniref:DUF7284 family protein n=1 Tax=Halomicrococcus gelatinilyticus TaxID=1702103 RepID=UPI002E0ECC8B
MRGISTAVDATLCLLLVSAAALVLVSADAPAERSGNPAAAVAETLTTSTAEVNYTLSVTGRGGVSLPDGPRTYSRAAHDTLTGLAAACATGDVSVNGSDVTDRNDDFERALEREFRSLSGGTGTAGRQVQVVARWEPYPDAPVAGGCTLGPSPPPEADVHAAVVDVPSGIAPVRRTARPVVGWQTYDRVADAVARRIVRGLFPPERLRASLQHRRTAPLTSVRFRRFAALTDANPGDELASDDLAGARHELAAGLSATLEPRLGEQYASPDQAARATAADRVEVVVRVWSP